MGHYSDYYAHENYEHNKAELARWEKAMRELRETRRMTIPNKVSDRFSMTWETLEDMVTARIAVLRQAIQSYEAE